MSTCQFFYDDLSIIYVFLSEKKHITTSTLISCCYSVLMPINVIYLSIQYLTSQQNLLSSRHNFLISRHNNQTSRHNYPKSSFQTIMLTCQMFCYIVISLWLLCRWYVDLSDNFVVICITLTGQDLIFNK